MHLTKIILFFSLLFHFSYGCATCVFMVPSVEVDAKLHVKEKELHQIDFTWKFSETFTKELIPMYDTNDNQVLDKEELTNILLAKLDYLEPKYMLTTIQYADDNATEALVLHPSFKHFTIEVVDNSLVFTYQAKLQKTLFDNASLSIALADDEGYFTFRIKQLSMSKGDFAYSKNLYLSTVSVLFKDKSLLHEITEPNTVQSTTKKPSVEQNPKENIAPIKEEKEEPLEEPFQKSLLKSSMEKIKSLFESIKDEKNPMTYLFLLFFAFAYGVIHALGPGHGKTLVASYFLSNDRSYSKAFFISLAIGVVHTFSAFVLTLVIYFLVNTLLAQFLDDTVYYTTKISALIIIAIALYLIYKKYLLYKKIEADKKATQLQKFSTSSIHLSTCGCHSCKVDKDSTDIALIISAGIIPCPGTTTLFIFAISTGLYYAGFISALVMSLGMSSVIFISALLSTIVRQKTLHSHEKLKKYLEFVSLLLILILGSVLLFF
ncbi:MAG: Nickel/cobalt efflux system [uncultured Sulfurovum sp.]|uniref:Nickel/cobalt efflux system n=1 Tax=uncultured Sulfurovum sp. TaxID=269237 RepID=A0A6S6SIG8_9BACT|nr:MAG: Nickel/cobalt efflux system [uncultured Sulfurovum sp.]